MKINHLNLSVPDVPQTARFFAEFFGLHLTEQKGRDTLAVLYDDAGFSLILSNFDRKIIPSYPRDFHLGFIQEDQEQVRAIHARLQAAGYTLKPPQGMHGSWAFTSKRREAFRSKYPVLRFWESRWTRTFNRPMKVYR